MWGFLLIKLWLAIAQVSSLFLFYQMQVTETTDIEDIKELPEIPAKCVARIILPPQLVEPFYKAVGINLQKQKKMIEIVQAYADERSDK